MERWWRNFASRDFQRRCATVRRRTKRTAPSRSQAQRSALWPALEQAEARLRCPRDRSRLKLPASAESSVRGVASERFFLSPVLDWATNENFRPNQDCQGDEQQRPSRGSSAPPAEVLRTAIPAEARPRPEAKTLSIPWRQRPIITLFFPSALEKA